MKLLSTQCLFVVTIAALLIANAFALAPKKIFITFDGTGNNAKNFVPDKKKNKTFTNVLKLHLLAGGNLYNENQRFEDENQICLYQRGVAAESNSKWVKKLRYGLGDLRQQTVKMKKQLEKVYKPGDKIYVVGFSRGSASARQFCVNLQNRGLKANNGNAVQVEFLGCFDTVAMQIWKHVFSIEKTAFKKEITKSSVLGEIDGKLPKNVKEAVHFVSLDDDQAFFNPVPFPPCLMDSTDPKVTEIWFPGIHKDVGGAYWEKGLADNACKKMQDRLKEAGLKFLEPDEIEQSDVTIKRWPYSNFKKPYPVDPLLLDITPNTADKVNFDDQKWRKDRKGKFGIKKAKEPSYRPVVTVTNEEIMKSGRPKIDIGVLEHFEAMQNKGTPYEINAEIKKANFMVVDGKGEELKAETKKFKELLLKAETKKFKELLGIPEGSTF